MCYYNQANPFMIPLHETWYYAHTTTSTCLNNSKLKVSPPVFPLCFYQIFLLLGCSHGSNSARLENFSLVYSFSNPPSPCQCGSNSGISSAPTHLTYHVQSGFPQSWEVKQQFTWVSVLFIRSRRQWWSLKRQVATVELGYGSVSWHSKLNNVSVSQMIDVTFK